MALLATACGSSSGGGDGVPDAGGGPSDGGGGGGRDGGGGGGGGRDGGGDGVRCDQLAATIRDFTIEHPDFEEADGRSSNIEPGLVKRELGADSKPQYARQGAEGGIHVDSPESFAEWYRDVPGKNMAVPFVFTLDETSDGVWEFADNEFFPIDGKGLGNQNGDHNFHFTTEIHTSFVYRGGEKFSFSGDDDLWLFVNGKLALDLGGLHPPKDGTVDMDLQAADLGLVIGETYPMDIFHAERHTEASNFKVSTTIDCFIVD